MKRTSMWRRTRTWCIQWLFTLGIHGAPQGCPAHRRHVVAVAGGRIEEFQLKRYFSNAPAPERPAHDAEEALWVTS